MVDVPGYHDLLKGKSEDVGGFSLFRTNTAVIMEQIMYDFLLNAIKKGFCKGYIYIDAW
jgi:hypothetical protein